MDDQRFSIQAELEDLGGAAVRDLACAALASGDRDVGGMKRERIGRQGQARSQPLNFYGAQLNFQLRTVFKILTLPACQCQPRRFSAMSLHPKQNGFGGVEVGQRSWVGAGEHLPEIADRANYLDVRCWDHGFRLNYTDPVRTETPEFTREVTSVTTVGGF